MTEPHFTLPKVRIEYAGKERFLCYPNRSLRRLKSEKGIDAIDAFQNGNLLDVLPLLLWAGLIWHEKELPLEEIEEYFLDFGGLRQNKEWSLDVTEALIGRRPTEKELSADPPVPEAVAAST
jgi:hypothetical protein